FENLVDDVTSADVGAAAQVVFRDSQETFDGILHASAFDVEITERADGDQIGRFGINDLAIDRNSGRHVALTHELLRLTQSLRLAERHDVSSDRRTSWPHRQALLSFVKLDQTGGKPNGNTRPPASHFAGTRDIEKPAICQSRPPCLRFRTRTR